MPFLIALQNSLRRGIGLLQFDAPVLEFLERDGDARHGAADESPRLHHAEIAVEVFHLGFAVHRNRAVVAVEHGASNLSDTDKIVGSERFFYEELTEQIALPAVAGAAHAAAVGLDAKQFESCLGVRKFADDIRKDLAQAEAAGVQGTPSFFLAVNDPATGKLKPIRFISGAQPFANFKTQIDAVLKEQGAPGGH